MVVWLFCNENVLQRCSICRCTTGHVCLHCIALLHWTLQNSIMIDIYIYIYIYWINSANKYTSRVNFVKSKETGNKNKNKQKCFCLPSIKWYLTKLQFNYSSKLNLWKKLVDLHICIALPCYSLIITVVLLV